MSTLRSLADQHDLLVGAAVSARHLQEEAAYAATLAREFNTVTTEGAIKFGPIHPAPDRYAWQDADTIVSFAHEHNMALRGHTLVWHKQQPAWITEGAFTRTELAAVLEEHIHTVVGRYRGRIGFWDVVNEAIGPDGVMRDTLWLRGIGPDYVAMAFRWAHEADPDAMLFYNYFGTLGLESEAVYVLVRDLVERGVPIQGVGLQMHVSLAKCPDMRALATEIGRLGELGLVVHFTEMDVRVPLPAGASDLAAQARIYADLARVCIDSPHCRALVLWGITDAYSWIPTEWPGEGAALLFDEAYREKPAYYALLQALGG